MADNTATTIDANVRVPRAIMAAAQKADEIHKLAYNTPDAPPAETPPSGDAPPAHSAPPPPSATPPPASPPQPPPETQEDWKGRYNSLKGRFDQQQGQLQNQAARLASLESTLANLSQPTRETTPQPTKTSSTPATKRVTKEEVEEYGEEFVDVVQRAAMDIVQPLLTEQAERIRGEFRTELQKTSTKVAGVEREAAVTQHQRLLTYLDNSVQNWRTINKHPKFLNWLNLTDPLSSVIRRNLLNDAVAQGDGSRAATFYRAFLAEEGIPDPASTNGAAPASTTTHGNGTGNGTGKIGLEALAAPGRPAASGAATTPSAPDTKPIITRAQISAFYANKARGAYSAQEAKEHEEMIFAAQKDGRIR